MSQMVDLKLKALVPTQVPGHPDEEFDGWWNTFIVRPLLPTESFIAWNEYRCTKGSPFRTSAALSRLLIVSGRLTKRRDFSIPRKRH